MYAIIKSGGKQHRVEKGTLVDVDLLPQEIGSIVTFDQVLLLADGNSTKLGVKAVVTGKLLQVVGGPKVDTMTYKRRKQQRRHWGHRQHYSRVEITDIK